MKLKKKVKAVKHWQFLSNTIEPCIDYDVFKKKKRCEETLKDKSLLLSDMWVSVTQHGAFSGCGGTIDVQIRSVAASVLHKLSRKTDRGWYSRSGEVLTTSHRVNLRCNELFRKVSDSDLSGSG